MQHYSNGLSHLGGVRLRQQQERVRIQDTEQNMGDDEELVTFEGSGGQQQSNRLTKTGKPDRRFKGQRDLPDEEVINPGYRRASSGQVLGGRHVTKDGSPDRRFKENRTISDDEAEIMKAELILAKHAGKSGASRH